MEGDDYIIPKEEHPFMHKARIRRELILNNMIHWIIHEYYEVSFHVPIESSIHDKQHVKKSSSKIILKYPWLSIYIHGPRMKGRSWNLQEGRAWNL
jgi:hypothetical protein